MRNRLHSLRRAERFLGNDVIITRHDATWVS
jgi:hypothetical protein